MVTLVGTQTNLLSLLKELIELDFDAIEAYEAAENRLENKEYKRKFAEFRADHERHTRELSQVLRDEGHDAPTGPSTKQWLTKGKVVLANLIGDKAILTAMRSNEDDTNTAYERAVNYEDKSLELTNILRQGLEDERRHREWIVKTLEQID
jgi:uncharacterized protein (TIGR02284 family)